jgi:hypothetical protein
MQEAVTLKPNSKFKKKKYGALGNLILKRLVPSPFFQKNHRSEKNDKNVKEFRSFTRRKKLECRQPEIILYLQAKWRFLK